MITQLKHNYIDVVTKSAYHFYGGSQLLFDGMIKRCGCSLIAAADLILYIRGRRRAIELDAYKAYVMRLAPAFPYIPYKGIPGFVLTAYLNVYFSISGLNYHASLGGLGGLPSSALSTDSISRVHGKAHFTDKALKNAKRHISSSLAADLPVILCIGPGIHQSFKAKEQRGIMLYTLDTDTAANASGSVGSCGSRSAITKACDSVSEYSIQPGASSRRGAFAQEGTDNFAAVNLVPVKRVHSHFVVITAIDSDNELIRVSSWGSEYYIRLSELCRYASYDMCGLYTNIIILKVLPNGYADCVFTCKDA